MVPDAVVGPIEPALLEDVARALVEVLGARTERVDNDRAFLLVYWGSVRPSPEGLRGFVRGVVWALARGADRGTRAPAAD